VTDYEPYPTVTFGGTTTYADKTISSISIRMGRNDVIEQPQPGFASIRLWTDASEPLDVALSQSVAISIDKGTSGTQQIFYGTISDIDISLEAYGSEGSIAIYSITAVGPLAQLNRHLSAASFPKEFEGTRILAILTDAFTTTWADVSATITWQDLPNDVTWASYDAISQALADNLVTNIDAPGQYELEAYTGGVSNSLSLAQIAAQSGRGILWESGLGEIYYDDYSARQSAVAYALTADDLLARGLQTAAQWGEIVNEAIVTYRAGEAVARDETSVVLYGALTGTRTTQLHNLADAQEQADDFIASRAYPRMYPETLTVPLHSPTVSDATRDQMAAIYCGLRVSTDALPAVFGINFDGFVEGWDWNITRYTSDISLKCSAYSETYLSIIWNQEPPNLTWASYTPTIEEWDDL
jgi:hypothetical protein